MTKKIIAAITVVLVVAIGLFVLLRWRRPIPVRQPQIPMSILPLGDGFPIELVQSDPTQAYKLLLDTGAFSYYTDPVRFAKVPLSGMNVKVTGNRSAPAWTTHPDTELTLWRLTNAEGKIKLVSAVDASESYVAKELLSVTISGGQWLRLSPEYTWEIDPEYFIAPPGIIQDLYLTDAAKVETYTFSSVTVDADGQIKKAEITGKASDELAETFKRTYKTSVIANWQVDVPSDIVRRMELKVPLEPGAQVEFPLMPNNGGMQFEITGVPDRDHVSFRMGSNNFADVSVGALRQLGALPVVVHLVKAESNILTVRVHAIDADKAQTNAVTVEFNVHSDVESHAVVPPVQAQAVQSLPNESTDFTTLRDISVWDLRGWRQVPPNKVSARWSPANYYNYLHVRKDKAANVYTAHFSTDGSAIDIRCITQDAKVFEAAPDPDPKHAGRKYYAIEVDAKDEAVGRDFLVVIEATYWNGFRQEPNWWVATYADDDAAGDIELATFVLFPEGKPFKTVDFALNGEALRADNIPFRGPDKRYVYWQIPHPKKGEYRVSWTW